MEIIADEETPDFIILTETHLTKDIDEHEIQIQEYDLYNTHSNSNRTGSVIIYFKKQWNVTKIGERLPTQIIGLVHIWQNLEINKL